MSCCGSAGDSRREYAASTSAANHEHAVSSPERHAGPHVDRSLHACCAGEAAVDAAGAALSRGAAGVRGGALVDDEHASNNEETKSVRRIRDLRARTGAVVAGF